MILIDSRKKITNLAGSQVEDQEEFKKLMEQGPYPPALNLKSTDRIYSLRRMDAPFQFIMETFREDGDHLSFILTQVSPDQTIYVSNDMPKEAYDINSFHYLHRHDFYELLYVVDGDVYQNIENSRHFYPKGSCCLLNPNVYHTEEREGSQRLLFLALQKEYLVNLVNSTFFFAAEETECFQKLRDFIQGDQKSHYSTKEYMDFIPLTEHADAFIHASFENLFLLMQEPKPGASYEVNSLILGLLCHLFQEEDYHPAPFHFASSKEEQLFREVSEYLNKRYNYASRTDLQEHFHYSGDHLYKLVKKFTGLSISEYTLTICLKKAAELLATTDMPISGIIEKLGFSNQTFFYRTFRDRYECSPAAYRRQHRI